MTTALTPTKRALPAPPPDIRADVTRLTERDIQMYVNPMATEAEAGIFLRLCLAERVNPFKGEASLVKYGKDSKAAFILDYTVYIKRANHNPHFVSSEDGLIFRQGDKAEFREGTFYFPEEEKNMVGGWCRIVRDDRAKPIFVAISRAEAEVYAGDKLGPFWRKSPGWMCNKTAIRRTFKRAFPEDNADLDDISARDYEITEDGRLPTAFAKNGQPDYELFYQRQARRGITHDQVHQILGVESIKDYVAFGRTLEDADSQITAWILARNNEQDKEDLFGNQRQLERQATADNAARPEVVAQAGPPLNSQGPETVSPSPNSTDPKPPAPAPGTKTAVMPRQDEATTFWSWARQNGYTPENIEKQLGMPIEKALKEGWTFPQIRHFCELLMDGRLPEDAKKLALEGK